MAPRRKAFLAAKPRISVPGFAPCSEYTPYRPLQEKTDRINELAPKRPGSPTGWDTTLSTIGRSWQPDAVARAWGENRIWDRRHAPLELIPNLLGEDGGVGALSVSSAQNQRDLAAACPLH
jgi:hypothetical protein